MSSCAGHGTSAGSGNAWKSTDEFTLPLLSSGTWLFPAQLHGVTSPWPRAGTFLAGWSPTALWVAAGAYIVRMFAITGFYHRKFSHHAFKTARTKRHTRMRTHARTRTRTGCTPVLSAALLLWLRLPMLGSAALVVPGWNATMPHTEACIAVPDCDAAGHCVHNNSRWAFVSLPKEGAAPASGWPVLIQLAIIDFAAANASIEANGGQCGLDGVIPFPKGGPGFRRRAEEQEDEDDGRPPGRRGFGITEEYQPFATPEEMMSPCSCFAPDGIYNCSTTADNGHHMSPGAGCSFDILAGGMWLQRQKQYLLANGVAVMTVNARTFDGWDIDNPSFDGHAQAPAGSNPFESTAQGADKPFFEALSKDMASGKLGALDPSRVAFHGWSGTVTPWI